MKYNVRWIESETKVIYKALPESEMILEYLEEKLFREGLVLASGENPNPERGYGVMVYYYSLNPYRQLLTAAPRRRNKYVHVVLSSGILKRSELLKKGFLLGNYPEYQPDLKVRSKEEVDKLVLMIKGKSDKNEPSGIVKKHYLDLMPFFEGYVRNYRRFNLTTIHNRSMFTKREIDYFANLGEMLGFDAFVEDSKLDKVKGRSRPMDLALWKWDQRVDKDNYAYLSLHLERENLWSKDEDTIEKLFSETEEGTIPHNVIGIQNIELEGRIDYLNELVAKRNSIQKSNVLMVYRYYDSILKFDRVKAYHFMHDGVTETRNAICKADEYGYYFMIFEEELVNLEEGIEKGELQST